MLPQERDSDKRPAIADNKWPRPVKRAGVKQTHPHRFRHTLASELHAKGRKTAIVRYNLNGQEAVVPIESRAARSYVIAFDNMGGRTTGVAMNAMSSQPVGVPVVVRDDPGNFLATRTIQLNANGHTSFTLAQQFPAASGIRGTFRVSSVSIGAGGINA